MNRTAAGLTGDFGTGIHPPIMHTGPGYSWCKNEVGLTQDGASMNIDIPLYGKTPVSDEDDTLLVERGFHCIGVIEVPVELTMSASGTVHAVAKSLNDDATGMITVAGSDESLQPELRTLDGLLIKMLRCLVDEYGMAGVRDTLDLIAKDDQP